jgi:hypothetical protein
LTTGLAGQEGNAFDTTALPTTESFNLRFTYDLRQSHTTPQADGFGFVIENAGPSAQGTNGGQLGFGGLPGQNVGILMRSWTNDLLQISTNSDISTADTLTASAYPVGQLADATGTEEISYDANTNLLSVTATPSAGQGSPVTLSVTLDLASLLGPTAWFGFTGATGGADSIQTIEAASFQMGTQTITGFPGESTVPCFVSGTHIRTRDGEIPVEGLAVGDLLVTVSDGRKELHPIIWIAQRRIDLMAHPHPEMVAPVRIQRSAFAEDVPHRDLLISPDHAVFVDGKLICARQLVNGTTIRQEKGRTSVEYFHIELEAHAILLAEGLPAESYLNTGNRGFFANSGDPLILHPDLTDGTDYPTREAGSCAPFVFDEAGVWPVWQRLVNRAEALGYFWTEPATTEEAGLHLLANGRSIWPVAVGGGRYVFALPAAQAGLGSMRLVSRSGTPSDLVPYPDDRRRLGVAVTRIIVRLGEEPSEIPIDHPALSRGWHEAERDGGAPWRWTNGDAVLPLPPLSGPTTLEIHLGSAMTYVIAAEPENEVPREVA